METKIENWNKIKEKEKKNLMYKNKKYSNSIEIIISFKPKRNIVINISSIPCHI